MAQRRVFFDAHPDYNCVRIESPNERGEFGALPATARDVSVVEHATIPTDRTFRDAWKADLTVDMDQAREIHRDRLRRIREPLLDATDVDLMTAIQSGDRQAQADISARKQALRDVTDDPAIAAAATPEELKAVVPEVLKG